MTTDRNSEYLCIPHYLDASAAVKLVVHEDECAAHLQKYFDKNVNHGSCACYITEFAFYEALSVLKRKWQDRVISGDQYHVAVRVLVSHVEDHLLQIDSDFRLNNLKCWVGVRELAEKYSLDYSDALQIFTVLNGQWHGSVRQCKTVFVTADCALAKAARLEGLRVWNPRKEQNPPNWDDRDREVQPTS